MLRTLNLPRRPKALARRCLLYLALICSALIFVVPILWMYSLSLRPVPEIFKYVVPLCVKTFIPETWTLSGYGKVLFQSPFPRFMMNSAFVAIVTATLSVAVNSLAAYAFARIRFPGANLLFFLLLLTIMLPFEVIAIPLYLVVKTLGWVDTYQVLIFPLVANAFFVFLLRQFFMEIPRDLEDAARIDGCSHLGIFWRVVLPLSKPALITLWLMSFQTSWDAFIWPLIATNSPSVRVIQVAIANLATQDVVLWDEVFSAVALGALPPILIFIMFQRYYVRGITMTGLKG
ncbi:MAG: carbohydrate ABC transporter permease [Chloroflexi bacterium]|nr:carbohydrate ABC transporter permease [Chloroflexota bacterium]